MVTSIRRCRLRCRRSGGTRRTVCGPSVELSQWSWASVSWPSCSLRVMRRCAGRTSPNVIVAETQYRHLRARCCQRPPSRCQLRRPRRPRPIPRHRPPRHRPPPRPNRRPRPPRLRTISRPWSLGRCRLNHRRHRQQRRQRRGQAACSPLQVATCRPTLGACGTCRLKPSTSFSRSASARCSAGITSTCIRSAVAVICGCSKIRSSITRTPQQLWTRRASFTTRRWCKTETASVFCIAGPHRSRAPLSSERERARCPRGSGQWVARFTTGDFMCSGPGCARTPLIPSRQMDWAGTPTRRSLLLTTRTRWPDWIFVRPHKEGRPRSMATPCSPTLSGRISLRTRSSRTLLARAAG